MSEIIGPLVLATLAYACGYFYGYGVAMRYCTKRLKEMQP
jgi:hypothetical protein